MSVLTIYFMGTFVAAMMMAFYYDRFYVEDGPGRDDYISNLFFAALLSWISVALMMGDLNEEKNEEKKEK